MILCRKGFVAPVDGETIIPGSTNKEIIAYYDGVEGKEPVLTLRLDNLKKGEYYVLYKPDFEKEHKVKR